MKAGELKVYYRVEEEGFINTGLDEAMKATLKKFGYRCWASGFDLNTNIRDMAFDVALNKRV